MGHRLVLLTIIIMVSLFLSALSIAVARADTYTLNLSSDSLLNAAESTGIWNISAGRIQAALAPGGAANEEVDFGDGRDGAFVDGPAQLGITVSGSDITIDTDTKAAFQFTSFTLSTGKTLYVRGSRSVTLRVMGTVTIAGTIDANGTSGKNNNDATAPRAGGSGTAGGGNGGDGGNAAAVGTGQNGSTNNATAKVGVGGAVANLNTEDKGAGGGCYGEDGDGNYVNEGADPNEAVVGNFPTIGDGGARGACGTWAAASGLAVLKSLFDAGTAGGAGGGGGGAYNNGGGGGAVDGAGGGGAGGGIRIASIGAITVNGSIQAIGGAGGTNAADNTAGDCGGGGGGGSGGVVWLQTSGTVTGTGTINVTGGASGSNPGCSGGDFAGGKGSRGAVRVDTSTGAVAATVAPVNAADASTTMSSPLGTYTVRTVPLDFASRYWSFSNVVPTTGCGSDGNVAVSFEGSQDGTTFGTAVAASQISSLNDYAYLRVKVDITVTGANPPCLTGLTFDQNLSELSELTLKGGLFCATIARRGGGSGTPLGALADFAMLLLAAFVGTARFRKLSTRVV